MTEPFLIGKRIYLRALCEADLKGNYFQWLNDYEVTRYTESGRVPNTVAAMESYFRSVIQNPANVALAIVVKKDDVHIGNVKLGPINWIHRCAEFGILIGEKEFRGKGYGPEATAMCLEYAFCRLNLHKIILGVSSQHIHAIRSYQQVGFREEGRLSEAMFVDGTYCDKILMGITSKQFGAGNCKPDGD